MKSIRRQFVRQAPRPDRHALYLDWENLWITFTKTAFPYLGRKRNQPKLGATPVEQDLLYKFPGALLSAVSNRLGRAPRFIKAFAVWDNLDHSAELMPRLRQSNIVPIQSLGKVIGKGDRQIIREASDRALILKVVEDVMLRPHAELGGVVIGTGDFGFAPLIEFLMEHTDLDVYILTCSMSLSDALRNMVEAAFGTDNVIVLDEELPVAELLKTCVKSRRSEEELKQVADMHATITKLANPAVIGKVIKDLEVAANVHGAAHKGGSVVISGAGSVHASGSVGELRPYSDPAFLECLVTGLHYTTLGYVSRFLVENRWVRTWERDRTFSAAPAVLIDEAIAAGIVRCVPHNDRDRVVMSLVLNLEHPEVIAILQRAKPTAAPTKPFNPALSEIPAPTNGSAMESPPQG